MFCRRQKMRKVLFIYLSLGIVMLFITSVEAVKLWDAKWFEGKIGAQWRFDINGGEDEAICVYTRNKRLNGKEYKEIIESPPFLGFTTVNDPFLTFRKNEVGIWGYGEIGNKVIKAIMLDALKDELAELKWKVKFDGNDWFILPNTLDIGRKFDTIEWNLKVWAPGNPWKFINIKNKISGIVEKAEPVKLDRKIEKAMKIRYLLQFSVDDDKEESELMTIWIAKNMGLVKVAYPNGNVAMLSLPKAVEPTKRLLTTWGSIKAR